ncbi:MAG: 3-hydroxyacyl-ACP dehydratase FabZ [Kiritimatiellia bacterium]|jgi:3-hydroxyacyl-[acyl-carrier-protein] dehydratase
MNTKPFNQTAGSAGQVVSLDLTSIKHILTHRYPMLMLDYAQWLPTEQCSIAWKCVAAGEPFFQGHFPARPVMPGVLILEAMLQNAGIALHHMATFSDCEMMVTAARKVKFRRPVLPGDLLQLRAQVRTLRRRAVIFEVAATVHDQIACQAEITITRCHALPPQAPPTPLPETACEPILSSDKILAAIPHRYPMLMVDAVLKMENNTLTAIKNVSGNEPFFQGHFPNAPVMPGSLLLETMAQAGAAHILRQPEHRNKLIYFMSVDRARFRHPVQPGCQLLITIQLLSLRSRTGRAHGAIHVNGVPMADAGLSFAIVDMT